MFFFPLFLGFLLLFCFLPFSLTNLYGRMMSYGLFLFFSGCFFPLFIKYVFLFFLSLLLLLPIFGFRILSFRVFIWPFVMILQFRNSDGSH